MASIRARGGRWEVRYRDVAGKARSKRFDRKSDARRFAGEVEADLRRGDWIDPRLARTRFSEWAEEYLATTQHLKAKTRDRYEHTLRTQVLPEFGNWPVGAIQQVDVLRLLSAMRAEGLSASSLKKIKLGVRQVLELARGSGAIKANPCDGIKVAQDAGRPPIFLTAEESERLAQAARGQYQTLVRFAVETGMRSGEVCGVRIGSLNLLKRTVEVVEALVVVRGRVIEETTKTYQRRTVKIGAELCDELAAHLAARAQGEGRPLHESERLFTAPRGGLLRSDLLLKRQVRPAAIRAGLPSGLRLHDLRHTSAALAIELGAHPKAIQERLGHSSISVTLDIYGHLFPSIDERLGDVLDAHLAQAREAVSRAVVAGMGAIPLPRPGLPAHAEPTSSPQNEGPGRSLADTRRHPNSGPDLGL